MTRRRIMIIISRHLRARSTGSESSLKAAKSLAIFDHEMLLATKSVQRSASGEERVRRVGGSAEFGVQGSDVQAAFGGIWRSKECSRCSLVSAESSQPTGSLSPRLRALNAERRTLLVASLSVPS